MEPHYITVYQIAADPGLAPFTTVINTVSLLLVGLIFVLILFFYLLWKKARIPFKQLRFLYTGVICWLCLFALVLMVVHISIKRSVMANNDATQALKTGNVRTVEGQVTNFDPMSYDGHKDECFSVQEKRFCYSDYLVSPGFRNTTSHGGPIRPGLQVQIAYITTASGHNAILRLNVAQ